MSATTHQKAGTRPQAPVYVQRSVSSCVNKLIISVTQISLQCCSIVTKPLEIYFKFAHACNRLCWSWRTMTTPPARPALSTGCMKEHFQWLYFRFVHHVWPRTTQTKVNRGQLTHHNVSKFVALGTSSPAAICSERIEKAYIIIS